MFALIPLVIKKFFKKIFVNKIPFIGKIKIISCHVSFLQTLSLLLKTGIPLQKGFELAHNTIENNSIRKELNQTLDKLSQGKRLETALEKNLFFPKNIMPFIKIGEQTGNLAKMLDKAAKVLEKTLDERIHFLTTIFQPILLAIIGIIIAFLIYSIYLPLFDMTGYFS